MKASRVSLLAFLLLATQGLLAWHAPSHLTDGDHVDESPLVQVIDCDLCASGQGLAPAPELEIAADAPRVSAPAVAIATGHNHPRIPGAGPRAPPVLS